MIDWEALAKPENPDLVKYFKTRYVLMMKKWDSLAVKPDQRKLEIRFLDLIEKKCFPRVKSDE